MATGSSKHFSTVNRYVQSAAYSCNIVDLSLLCKLLALRTRVFSHLPPFTAFCSFFSGKAPNKFNRPKHLVETAPNRLYLPASSESYSALTFLEPVKLLWPTNKRVGFTVGPPIGLNRPSTLADMPGDTQGHRTLHLVISNDNALNSINGKKKGSQSFDDVSGHTSSYITGPVLDVQTYPDHPEYMAIYVLHNEGYDEVEKATGVRPMPGSPDGFKATAEVVGQLGRYIQPLLPCATIYNGLTEALQK
jgi:hypothetical protein